MLQTKITKGFWSLKEELIPASFKMFQPTDMLPNLFYSQENCIIKTQRFEISKIQKISYECGIRVINKIIAMKPTCGGAHL